ncbi:acyltransferase [Marinobacter panjinensis]|uniref:Acyltransferase n=1 Tax=Marinobacter panjinensis TaxID=2576384 RepID=A0A4U6R1I9_9GAMM|nr:acyltransferase family protein [Marinobacter panjinensis]MCR8915833.1 acyltransferase [Marinobacter panjinensis]TKV67191.1 acyltransferase [Marinobacter panjinensis]
MKDYRVPASGYRPEIQGLRAIAAILVAIYHIWFARVSGGVDVFFVVSGFLITGSLARQVQAQGNVMFLRFWAGLIKRLIPAALLVITVTAIASFLLLPKVNWIPIIKQGAAAILYMENWQQAFSAVDYLADRETANPFQHYWALSVQGQFYLMWPLLIGAILFVARRFRLSLGVLIPCVLAIIFTSSLVYSVYSTYTNQAFAYFNTFARMWEFALGGLLVFALPYLGTSRSVRLVLGWVGVLAIISCGLLLQVSTVFPGYAALWPTVAACLVIVCGSADRFGAGAFLSSRFFTWFGDISYSFYLWHWPVLTFYLLLQGSTQADIADGFIVLGVSGLLAWITARVVEEPARFSAIGKRFPSRAFVFGLTCCMPAVLVFGAWSAHTVAQRKADAFQTDVIPGEGAYPGAVAVATSNWDQQDNDEYHSQPPVYPDPFTVHNSIPESYFDGCHKEQKGTDADYCVYGDGDGKISLALVGGSHSAQWLPALEKIALRQGWKILNFTKSECWFSAELKDGSNQDCLEWNENVLATLIETKPDYVFTMATRAEGGNEHVPAGYVDYWEMLSEHGIEVIGVRDNPWWQGVYSPAECVDVFGPGSPRCKIGREEVLAEINPSIEVAKSQEGLSLLDLSDYLCDENLCHPVIGNIQVYRDRHHISLAYMESLAPVLELQMIELEPGLSLR